MNALLQAKYDKLNSAQEFECWYLVKQPTGFAGLCYLVSFLRDYKEEESTEVLSEYISERLATLLAKKPMLNISDNYRALRVAAFFGLIEMTDTRYEHAVITASYDEIYQRCSGAFENTDSYVDIIQRQIEKMFISSEIDEESSGVRSKYRLYPVMLLYKVLLELGRSTGSYSISMDEYRYFIATTEKFEDFLDTLLLITLLRAEKEEVIKFQAFKGKFDNRLIQALKQLPTLEIGDEKLKIKSSKIEEVAEKVFIFEKNPQIFATDAYIGFLGSSQSLFQLKKYYKVAYQSNVEKNRLPGGKNILLYGVPGSGKSYTIAHEYAEDDAHTERVVFHPDYTYSDFVGQILPKVEQRGDGTADVSYEFVPGPFTKILKNAFLNPSRHYVLIIEELNRGNAPAIFGEIFQLLDRKLNLKKKYDDGFTVGTSEYGVTSKDIAKEVYGDDGIKVRIPSNLDIVATMNTSDQNAFTLDTAFQRRWNMVQIENSFDNVDEKFAEAEILDTTIKWKAFCETINKVILTSKSAMATSEDKRLGVFFITLDDIRYSDDGVKDEEEFIRLRKKERHDELNDAEKERLRNIRIARNHNRIFPEKVLKYLWDDAFKFNPEMVFDKANYDSLESVIKAFTTRKEKERFVVLSKQVRESLGITLSE